MIVVNYFQYRIREVSTYIIVFWVAALTLASPVFGTPAPETSKVIAGAPAAQTDPFTGEPVTLLVLGDSLSAAYKLPSEKGWVALLQQELTRHAESGSLPPSTIVNASVSGITATTGLAMLPRLLNQHKPQIVVIELGANDGLQGHPVSRIKTTLTQLVLKSRQAGADVLLLGVRLPPNRGSRYTEPFFAQYQQIADEQSIALVPFFLEGVAGNPALMMSDGLHPNEKGQPVILENVLPAVVELIQAQPGVTRKVAP